MDTDDLTDTDDAATGDWDHDVADTPGLDHEGRPTYQWPGGGDRFMDMLETRTQEQVYGDGTRNAPHRDPAANVREYGCDAWDVINFAYSDERPHQITDRAPSRRTMVVTNTGPNPFYIGPDAGIASIGGAEVFPNGGSRSITTKGEMWVDGRAAAITGDVIVTFDYGE